LRRPYREPDAFERPPTLFVAAEQRNSMKRAGPSRIAAQGHGQATAHARSGCRRRRAEVRMAEAQTVVAEQPPSATLRVDGGENSVEELLIADEAPPSGRPAWASDEGHRRQLVPQRKRRLGRPRPRFV